MTMITIDQRRLDDLITAFANLETARILLNIRDTMHDEARNFYLENAGLFLTNLVRLFGNAEQIARLDKLIQHHNNTR